MTSRLQFGSKKCDYTRSGKSYSGRQRTSSPSGIFQRIPALLDEVREYASHYIAAKKDLTRAKSKELAAKAVLLALIGIAALGAVLGSVLLLLSGIAIGLGKLFGDRYWLGFLVTGVLLLGIIGLGAWYGLKRWQNSSRESTIRRYEQRHELQRSRFNRSVSQPDAAERHVPAAAPPPPVTQHEPIS